MSNSLSQHKIETKPKPKGIVLVSNKGRLQSKTGKRTFGSLTKTGYMRFATTHGTYDVHSLVLHAFVGPRPTPQHTVDHIDDSFQGRSNNSLENLVYATQSQQTAKAWVKRKKNIGASTRISKAIQGKRINEDDNSWVSYYSVFEAAKSLGICRQLISNVCVGKATATKGYNFRVKPIEIIDGEEWRDVVITGNTKNTGWKISNFGRAMTTQGAVTTGYAMETRRGSASAYHTVSINHGKYYIHRLVASAFLGPPPSPESNTVDHIDGNPSNNCLENLRWFSQRQQNESAVLRNQNTKTTPTAKSKAVLGRRFCSVDEEWTLYSSPSSAAETLQINAESIRSVCRGLRTHVSNRVQKVKYVFKWKDQHDLEGEIWREIDFGTYVYHKSCS